MFGIVVSLFFAVYYVKNEKLYGIVSNVIFTVNDRNEKHAVSLYNISKIVYYLL